MLGTVKLYDKAGVMTVKIGNIMVYHLLAEKTHRVTTQEIIPQMPLFFRHVFS